MSKDVEYYKKAAEQNLVPVLNDFGWIYYYGTSYQGIQEDKEKALAYYQRVADLGNERSMHALGHIYLSYGFNYVLENIQKGLYYYHLLAEKDYIGAVYALEKFTGTDSVLPLTMPKRQLILHCR